MTRRLISGGSPYEATLGYSRAVVQGDWCFVAGSTGVDLETKSIPESVSDQARNAFRTIGTALGKAGFGFADVIRVNYILTDRAYVEELTPVLAEVFSDIRPAATMIFAGLIHPDMKVEIEVTAFKG